MAQYKCIHETLLRRAEFAPQVRTPLGDAGAVQAQRGAIRSCAHHRRTQTCRMTRWARRGLSHHPDFHPVAAWLQVLYSGEQPLTSPWSPSLIQVQWAQPVSLWQADCTLPYCCTSCVSTSSDNCADTVSRGLFYASAWTGSPDARIALAQDVSLTKPTGPRRLAPGPSPPVPLPPRVRFCRILVVSRSGLRIPGPRCQRRAGWWLRRAPGRPRDRRRGRRGRQVPGGGAGLHDAHRHEVGQCSSRSWLFVWVRTQLLDVGGLGASVYLIRLHASAFNFILGLG